MKGIEVPLDLVGHYSLRWRDYSQLEGSRGHFRALVVQVG